MSKVPKGILKRSPPRGPLYDFDTVVMDDSDFVEVDDWGQPLKPLPPKKLKKKAASPPRSPGSPARLHSPPRSGNLTATKERRTWILEAMRQEFDLVRTSVNQGFEAAEALGAGDTSARARVREQKKTIEQHLNGIGKFARALTHRTGPIGHPLIPDANLPRAAHVSPPRKRVQRGPNVFTRTMYFSDEFEKFIRGGDFGLPAGTLDPLLENNIANRLLLSNLIVLYTWVNGLRPQGLIRGMRWDDHFRRSFPSTLRDMRARRPKTYEFVRPMSGTVGIVEKFTSGSMFQTDLPAIVALNVSAGRGEIEQGVLDDMQPKVEKINAQVRAAIEKYKTGQTPYVSTYARAGEVVSPPPGLRKKKATGATKKRATSPK